MITIERWQQVKELFHSALGREASERQGFLREACAGDEILRKEVLSLLDSHEQQGSFLDAPAFEVAAELLAVEEAAPLKDMLVGHYRIQELLGRGGMGEIYLAHDTGLDRKVALKVLPPQYTEDGERLTRFRREARAASALNHPNILTIYEIVDAGSLHFIATEFIEGETLRERITRGGMKITEALDIATQIASALEAAHEAGIIHRDVKPENIMVRRDGYVKVLDFGLAKLMEPRGEINLEGATKLLHGTQPGIVMGTVQYMSPEQARGLAVDGRTDIWSLGVVLYEMVAHRAPFAGQTMTDVLAAILEREPATFASIALESPAQLEWVIRKALRKGRDERYQTARELLGDLRSLKEQLEFEAKLDASSSAHAVAYAAKSTQENRSPANGKGATESVKAQTTDAALESRAGADKKSRARVFWLSALLLLIGVGAAFAAYKFLWMRTVAGSFDKIKITQLTTSRNLIHAAISPDGKYIAYVVSDREQHSLWLRQVSASNDTLIIPPAQLGYWGVSFSRDGNDLYYVTRGDDGIGTLYRVPALGGTPRRLLSNVDSAVTLSPDGKYVAFVRGNFPKREESALVIADIDTEAERVLAVRRRPDRFYPLYFTGPSWSPDGQYLACAVGNLPSPGAFYSFKVSDGTEKQLTPKVFSQLGRVEWLRDMSGLVMVASDQFKPNLPGQIWFVSYPGGELRQVTNDLNDYRALSVTADGASLVTVSVSEFANLWVAPEGDALRARQVSPVRTRGGVAWTPDGRIVYSTETGGVWDLWIMNQDGSNRRQLTNGAGHNLEPSVSPDGRHIAYISVRSGSVDIWRMDINGGNAVQLTREMIALSPSFSHDGEWVVFSSAPLPGAALQRGQRIMRVRTSGGEPSQLSDAPGYRPVVSPDGRWVAFFYSDAQATATDRYRLIAIIPFAGGAPVRTLDFGVSTTTRDVLQWTPDGRAVVYNLLSENVSNLWKLSIDGGTRVKLTDFKESQINDFAFSRDGRQLVLSRGTVIRDAVMITNQK